MGLRLIDAANFEELAQVCNRLNRWEFMFVMAPLRFPHATGLLGVSGFGQFWVREIGVKKLLV